MNQVNPTNDTGLQPPTEAIAKQTWEIEETR